jgi:hypothetical protein
MPNEFASAYHSLIEQKFQERDGTPFPNGSSPHAEMLIAAFFKFASSRVRILTGHLDARVFASEKVIWNATQFLASPDHSLEIIFHSEIEDQKIYSHPLISKVFESAEALQVWKVRPSLRSGITAHFVLMDDDSYRFEVDKEGSAGVAAFGDKDFAAKLAEIFDGLKTMASDSVPLKKLAYA